MPKIDGGLLKAACVAYDNNSCGEESADDTGMWAAIEAYEEAKQETVDQSQVALLNDFFAGTGEPMPVDRPDLRPVKTGGIRSTLANGIAERPSANRSQHIRDRIDDNDVLYDAVIKCTGSDASWSVFLDTVMEAFGPFLGATKREYRPMEVEGRALEEAMCIIWPSTEVPSERQWKEQMDITASVIEVYKNVVGSRNQSAPMRESGELQERREAAHHLLNHIHHEVAALDDFDAASLLHEIEQTLNGTCIFDDNKVLREEIEGLKAPWRSIETAPFGATGKPETYFIGARRDICGRINTATCYRNKHGAYEWWGGGLSPSHWMPIPTLSDI